jgi:cell division inhibitor SepF
MMAAFIDKLLRIIGFEDEVVEEEVLLSSEPEVEREMLPRSGKGKVISLHNPGRMRVMVVEPTCFEDAKRVVDHLKSRKPVVVNMESTAEDVAQRIIDFVSGASFATDGNTQKVGQGIFLFTPNNVDIAAEIKESKAEERESPFLWAR